MHIRRRCASAWLLLGFGLPAFGLAGCGREQPASPALVLQPVVDEIPLATTSADERFHQLGPSVVALPGGGLAVGWEVGVFPGRDVAVQWLAADGRPLLPAGGRLLGAAQEDEGSCVLAPHATSGAFVAYVRRHASGNSSQVVVHSLDELGRARWPSEGVVAIEGPRFRMEAPHLTSDGAGGVFACATANTSRSDVRCQHLDPVGRLLWDPTGVDAGGTPGPEALPRGVPDGTGGLLVFWQNQGDPLRMEGQRLAPDGAPLWGPTGRVVHQTSIPAIGGYGRSTYGVVSDGQGGAVLTFHDLLPSGTVAQRVNRDGAVLWGSGVRVNAAAGPHGHEATIAAGDGGAFVVLSERSSADRNQLSIYRLGAGGGHSWPATGTALSDPASTASNYGAVGSFQGGVLWMAWTHQTAPRSLEMDVRLARFSADGSRLDPPAGVLASGAPSGQFTQEAAFSAASNRFFIVWDDLRRTASFRDGDVYGGLVRLEPQRP